MIKRHLYDILVSGYFKINFSNIKHFGEARNIEYLTIGLKNKKIVKLLLRDIDTDPFDNGSIIFIEGVLNREVYKDKYTDDWIDKGLYIEVSAYELVNKETLEAMRKFDEANRNNKKLGYGGLEV